MGDVITVTPLLFRQHIAILDDPKGRGFLVEVTCDPTAYPFAGEFDHYADALDHALWVKEALSLPVIDRSRMRGLGDGNA